MRRSAVWDDTRFFTFDSLFHMQAIVRHARHDGSLKQSQDHLRKMDRRKATTKKYGIYLE